MTKIYFDLLVKIKYPERSEKETHIAELSFILVFIIDAVFRLKKKKASSGIIMCITTCYCADDVLLTETRHQMEKLEKRFLILICLY